MNRKTNLLCILGLILSLSPIILFTVIRVIYANRNYSLHYALFGPFCLFELILAFAGLVLSIAGAVSASKNGVKIPKSGVTGIIISSFGVVLVALLIWFGNYLSKAYTTPPDYSIKPHNSNIESIRKEIEDAMNEKTPEETSEKPLEDSFHLTLGYDYSIIRDDIDGFRGLTWHIERNGKCVFDRNTGGSLMLDKNLQWTSGGDGKFTVYLIAYVDGSYQRVSNIIEYTVEKDQTTESK